MDETGDIKYANTVPGSPESGGHIFHGIIDEAFDAFHEIYNTGHDNVTNIECSRTTKDGRVKDLAQFGDQDWHCWATAVQDIDCP